MSKASRVRRIRPVSVVSIAASDSGGGAGIQADLLTFAAHGVHGTTVLTGATAQNTVEIRGIESFTARFLAQQIDAVFSDLRPAAVKIGMVSDAPRIRTLAAGLRKYGAKNVVLDPVMVAKSGRRLLSASGFQALQKELLPLCDLVTPNVPEAEVLTGVQIRRDAERVFAVLAIHGLGVKAVLLKGGHARGERVRDLLFDGTSFREFVNPRIATRATHGTGCTLSSAIAANLALGLSLQDSVKQAIRYLRAGLKRGLFPGKGLGVPDHFARNRFERRRRS